MPQDYNSFIILVVGTTVKNNLYKNQNGYDLAILFFGEMEKVVLFIFNS